MAYDNSFHLLIRMTYTPDKNAKIFFHTKHFPDKLSKKEGCLKLAMKPAFFKNHFLVPQDLWSQK